MTIYDSERVGIGGEFDSVFKMSASYMGVSGWDPAFNSASFLSASWESADVVQVLGSLPST